MPNYIYASEILASKLKIGYYFIERFLEYVEKKDPDSANIVREITKNNNDSSDNLLMIIEKLYPRLTEKTTALKNELDNALNKAQSIDTTINAMEDKLRQAQREKEFLIKQHQDEKQILLEKIHKLEEENKMMTERILKKTKDMVNESFVNTNNNVFKK
jgi:TolA-binding protein